jgi:hypothetical protein
MTWSWLLGRGGSSERSRGEKLGRRGHLLAIRAGLGCEGVGGDPTRGGLVDHGPRRGGDGDRDVLLQGAVAGRVIRGALLPALPHDAAPCAAERVARGWSWPRWIARA